MKGTLLSFVLGASIATGVAITTNTIKDTPKEDVTTIEPTTEAKEAILTKHPYLAEDRTECEKMGGSLSVNVNTKYQNTSTTTEPIETMTLECLKGESLPPNE